MSIFPSSQSGGSRLNSLARKCVAKAPRLKPYADLRMDVTSRVAERDEEGVGREERGQENKDLELHLLPFTFSIL